MVHAPVREDVDILGPVHSTLYPSTAVALQSIPHADVGGFSGWERAVGSAKALRNAVGHVITVYCIFDRDYYPQTALTERAEKAAAAGVTLHVWARKELENYLLAPSALARVIAERARVGVTPPTADDVADAIDRIADELREDVMEAVVTAFEAQDRRKGPGTAYRPAAARVKEAWKSREQRWGLIGGKEALSRLSKWAQANYGASFGVGAVARALQPPEVPDELRAVLASIEMGRPFAPPDAEVPAPSNGQPGRKVARERNA